MRLIAAVLLVVCGCSGGVCANRACDPGGCASAAFGVACMPINSVCNRCGPDGGVTMGMICFGVGDGGGEWSPYMCGP